MAELPQWLEVLRELEVLVRVPMPRGANFETVLACLAFRGGCERRGSRCAWRCKRFLVPAYGRAGPPATFNDEEEAFGVHQRIVSGTGLVLQRCALNHARQGRYEDRTCGEASDAHREEEAGADLGPARLLQTLD